MGSSTRVTPLPPTCSPIRPAKNERPLATASPDRAPEITDSRVVAARRSNTTVRRPEDPLVAPSMRTARSTASAMARSGSSPSNPRPTEYPPPVWLPSPSPAMTPTDRKPEVFR